MSRVLRHFTPYLANIFLIWAAITLYQTNGYYAEFLRIETQAVLFYLAVAYTAGGLLYYALSIYDVPPVTKGLLILRGFARLLRGVPELFRGRCTALPEQERVALLFGLVKLFFLPLMINFLFFNIGDVERNLASLRHIEVFTLDTFSFMLFPMLIALIFTIDTLYFAFGYTFEASFLKNTVRSVEPTLLGWAVTLASYPPFNGLVTVYILWYANDFITFSSDVATAALRAAILFFLTIYVWASVALGAKCSNLTNRGVVSRFPYAIIRHPAYVTKNIAWWLSVLPLLNPVAYASMFAWSTIYYLRAVTEERHLMRDPEYQTYAQKVRWKFVPGIW